MIRADMISTVGRAYLTSNIENDEYSYPNNRIPFGYFYQRTFRSYTIHDYIQKFTRSGFW